MARVSEPFFFAVAERRRWVAGTVAAHRSCEREITHDWGAFASLWQAGPDSPGPRVHDQTRTRWVSDQQTSAGHLVHGFAWVWQVCSAQGVGRGVHRMGPVRADRLRGAGNQ